MIEIPLTQGKVALIDDEDYDLISKFKWCTNKIGSTFYAATCHSDGRVFHMHSLLLLREHGQDIDHINRDGLDNRRSNLRLVSRSDNNKNSKLRCDSTTGIKRVYWNAKNSNWYARISVNKKWKYLGSFTSKEEAVVARKRAELAIGGYNVEINWRT